MLGEALALFNLLLSPTETQSLKHRIIIYRLCEKAASEKGCF